MKTIWMIESSDPREFCYANCIAVTMCVAGSKHEFDNFEEAVACIPELQAENPDLDYWISPREKLNHGYGPCDDTRHRRYPPPIFCRTDQRRSQGQRLHCGRLGSQNQRRLSRNPCLNLTARAHSSPTRARTFIGGNTMHHQRGFR
jgi:hypothetical protein